jgi:hypothetical protein
MQRALRVPCELLSKWFKESAGACDPMLVDGAGSPPTTEPPESTTSATDADVVMGEAVSVCSSQTVHAGLSQLQGAVDQAEQEAQGNEEGKGGAA